MTLPKPFRINALCLCLAAAFEISGIAPVAAQKTETPVDAEVIERRQIILDETRSNDTTGTVRARLLLKLASSDLDGIPGFSAEDLDILVQVRVAQQRSKEIASMLRYDLDGDFVVTGDELELSGFASINERFGRTLQGIIPNAEQRVEGTKQFVARALEADANGDGRLTLDDLDQRMEAAEDRIRTSQRQLGVPWAFDVNVDGRITEPEMRRDVDANLAWIDADANGVIVKSEIDAARAEIRKTVSSTRRLQVKPRGCQLPAIPKDAKILVLAGDGGTGLTDLLFENSQGLPVTLAEVDVPTGDAPLVILASFRNPTILRIDGAADRVSHVVGLARPVGALGAESAKSVQTNCPIGFLGIRIKEQGEAGLRSQFARLLRGRDFDLIEKQFIGRVEFVTGANNTRNLLSGHDTPEVEGDARLVRDTLLRFSPGGFHIVDPRAVQSMTAVQTRTEWPLEAGLLQLIAEGAIKVQTSPTSGVTRRIPQSDSYASQLDGMRRAPGQNTVMSDGFIFSRMPDGSWVGRDPVTIIVNRKITMPIGLTDRRGLRVVVPPGVPKPGRLHGLREN